MYETIPARVLPSECFQIVRSGLENGSQGNAHVEFPLVDDRSGFRLVPALWGHFGGVGFGGSPGFNYERVPPHMKIQCSALMGSVDRWFFTRGPETGSVDRSVDRCFFTRGLRGP